MFIIRDIHGLEVYLNTLQISVVLPKVPRDQPIKTLSNQLIKSGLEVISPKGYKIVLDMDMNSVCSVQVEVNYM